MKLEFLNFTEVGNLEKERLVLKAGDDLDIGKYIIMRSKRGTTGSPTSGSKNAYWLPDLTVKAGDLIVIYSKAGKARKKNLDSGKTVHFYYWHFKKPIWGPDTENTAVLINVRQWEHQSPGD